MTRRVLLIAVTMASPSGSLSTSSVLSKKLTLLRPTSPRTPASTTWRWPVFWTTSTTTTCVSPTSTSRSSSWGTSPSTCASSRSAYSRTSPARNPCSLRAASVRPPSTTPTSTATSSRALSSRLARCLTTRGRAARWTLTSVTAAGRCSWRTSWVSW